jgi:hypothetical protein
VKRSPAAGLSADYWQLTAPPTDRRDGVVRVGDRAAARHVERFAHYFRREFGYDFVQFEAHEDVRWTARPQNDDPHPYLIAYRNRLVGAACFRWRVYTNVAPTWWLAWIWLHPYARRRGVLTQAWPIFTADHPGFFVEPPLSTAMEGFLTARAYPWYPALPTEGPL